jgi:hypothetical protein
MPENNCTESVIFDIVKVSLPFNAIIGSLALNQFMAVAHYGYLVWKMPSPSGNITIRRDRSVGVSMLEKLHVLVAAQEATSGYGAPDQAPSSLHQRVSSSTPTCSPQTNRNSRSSPSSGIMLTSLPGNRHRCPRSLGR